MRKILKNKPLIEAIFEMRWELEEEKESKFKLDPHYKLLIGRLYDKLNNQYPYHEQLPSTNIPDIMANYIVQNRFRKAENEWPLIQLGPGIMTVNDTEGYIWEDFQKRITQAIDYLYDVYPNSNEDLILNKIMLRYIDAVNFDFENLDIFSFLKENMNFNLEFNQKLFEDNVAIEPKPSNINLTFNFKSLEPKGIVYLRFASGKVKESNALIWETVVQSFSEDAPKIHKDIFNWINNAHNLTDNWFFKLIEGNLLKRFE